MPETPEKQKRMAEAKARGESVRANLATGGPEKAAREWLASYGAGLGKNSQIKGSRVILDNIGTATDSGERGKFSCADIQKFNFPILLLNGEKSPKLYGDMIAAMRQCKPDIPASNNCTQRKAFNAPREPGVFQQSRSGLLKTALTNSPLFERRGLSPPPRTLFRFKIA